jgi:hypothetical protein
MEKLLYGGSIPVTFNEKTHRYSVNGKSVPSVTGILGIINKPFLVPWAVNLACDHLIEIGRDRNITASDVEEARTKHRDAKEEAAGIGSKVHGWVEKFIQARKNGEADPELPTDEKILNGILGFVRWQDANGAKFTDTEVLVYSKLLGYCGLFDALGELNGVPTIFEWKTSKAIYDEYALQTAAYAFAFNEERNKAGEPIQRVIARFDKMDGSFEARVLPVESFSDDLEGFCGALALYEWQKSYGK